MTTRKKFEAVYARRAEIHYVPTGGTYTQDLARVGSSEEAAICLRRLYGTRATEVAGALALNSRCNAVAHCLLAQGGDSHGVLEPRELVRFLALAGAKRCVLFHNHPSGDLAWSQADVDLTKSVAKLCQLLGVTLVDHILLTHRAHLSMCDQQHPALRLDDALSGEGVVA